MRRPLVLVRCLLATAAVLLLGVPGGGASENLQPPRMEVSCSRSEGCFLLLREALEQAPDSAVIQIGPGVYYEKPLIVNKSVALQGAGADRTRIQLVDPDAVAISVRGAGLSVEIRDLAIQGGPRFSLRSEEWSVNSGTAISVQNDPPESEIRTRLRVIRSRVVGIEGMELQGAEVIITDSEVFSVTSGIRGSGRLEIQSSSLRSISFQANVGPSNGVGIWFLGPRLVLKHSTIEDYWVGLRYDSIERPGSGLFGELISQGNLFTQNDVGVIVGGSLLQATFLDDSFTWNLSYGLVIADPSCGEDLGLREFIGSIDGAGNEFAFNGQGDICPEDYPLPSGFRKP